jgi:hypothetical protein
LTEPAERLDLRTPPTPSGAEAVGFWTVVKESVRGEVHHDFTEGPFGRAVLLLAVPMVLEVALESIFAGAGEVEDPGGVKPPHQARVGPNRSSHHRTKLV